VKPPADGAESKVSPAINSWPTGRKLVALTYDDGPHGRYTPMLMELLEAKKVPATFFLLGESVSANPKIAAQLAAAGFEVANHSYTHKEFTRISEDAVRRELVRTHDLITSVTGAPVRVMRPPYGSHNSRVRAICEDQGYKVIMWDVDTNDWRNRTAAQMVDYVLANTRDGSIILMHDRFQKSVDATAEVIDGLRAKGFEFASVSQLLSMPKAGAKLETSGTATGNQGAAGGR
jgi:peptidoglycan/xylan/chitin deacetylase (PgdA/CDA1 family)